MPADIVDIHECFIDFIPNWGFLGIFCALILFFSLLLTKVNHLSFFSNIINSKGTAFSLFGMWISILIVYQSITNYPRGLVYVLASETARDDFIKNAFNHQEYSFFYRNELAVAIIYWILVLIFIFIIIELIQVFKRNPENKSIESIKNEKGEELLHGENITVFYYDSEQVEYEKKRLYKVKEKEKSALWDSIKKISRFRSKNQIQQEEE